MTRSMKKLLSFLKDRGHDVGDTAGYQAVGCAGCGYLFYIDEEELKIYFGTGYPKIDWEWYDNLRNYELHCNDFAVRYVLK